MSGQVDANFCHHRVPAFLLRKNKMRMPKMNSLMSKQDVEFIDYYEGYVSVSSLNWLMRTGTGFN